MIRAEQLSYGFSDRYLYQDISFTLPDNSHCVLIGSNGSGKSTLVDLIRQPDAYLYDGTLFREGIGRIGFASQFLPWVLVPRSTFIYHYFASVPFIIIASALLLDWIRSKSETAFQVTSGALLASSALLFAAFYPLESGLPCSRAYAKYLRWFKWYNF